MAYGSANAVTDPTNVMGRRIGAWVIDAILVSVIVRILVPNNNVTTHTNVATDYCTRFQRVHSGYFCIQGGGTAYTLRFPISSLLIQLAYYFVVMGVMQGATGASVGKFAFGLRVVDANGQICGIPKALLRTLIGVFELGLCFPVGLLTAALSHPHRRLGDLAAGTFVVPSTAVGTPIMSGQYGYQQAWTPQPPAGWGPPPAAGSPPWGPGAAAPGLGTPPAASPAPSSAPPTWGTPAANPPPAQTPGTWGAPPATQPAPQPTPAAEPAPAMEPAPSVESEPVAMAPAVEPEPVATAPQAEAAAPSREPQWDAQRNAWVFWEAETNRWLQHDPATGQWGPLT